MKRLAVGLSLVLLLSGCSAAEVNPSSSPVGSAPADAMASFKQIASDSCDKGFSDGVVETRDDSGLLVMVPKEQGVDGYSAVFKDLDTGMLDLIYEADGFYACAAALMWSMAQESGEGEIDGVSVSWDNGVYVLEEKFEDSTFTYRYNVQDGLIVGGQVTSTEDETPTLFTETYGNVSDENKALIKQAVAELNASE